jgi:outer membrane protein assembly factor BamB
VRQYVQLSGRGLISVAADDGRTLWAYNKIANHYANICTPVVSGDYVLASTVHAADPHAGTVLMKISSENGTVKAEEVYRLTHRQAANHHGGMVLVGDYVYMGHGYNRGFPLCMELKTGKVLWRPGRGPGSGSAAIVYADGHLYFHYEDGAVALIEASPNGYVLKGHFKLPTDRDKDWSHPVVANGRLYIRGQDKLMCFNVAKR